MKEILENKIDLGLERKQSEQLPPKKAKKWLKVLAIIGSIIILVVIFLVVLVCSQGSRSKMTL